MQTGSKFLKGAMILTAAGVVVKVLGAVYRIPLYGILGEVGMGLFMAVYPVYSMMLSISTAGVPVAVSKLVAERLARGNYRDAHQVFRVALGLMAASGLAVTGLLLLSARYYTANILEAPGALLPLVAIAPSIIFYATKSAFRGFFQGQQTMVPTAVSQVVEQVFRVITIFILSALLVKYSVELGAAGAALGTVVGAATALLYLAWAYWRQRTKFLSLAGEEGNTLAPAGQVLREILVLALPITIGSIVVPLVNMVDSTLILPRLQAGGFSEEQALAMYGNFSGAAMPLVNVPTIFTMALATSLVPAIADAHAHENAGQIRTLSSLAIRIGLMLGLPAALGLYQLARPVSILLYNNAEVARSLQVAAFAIIFISLKQTTAPVLQGLGKTYLPVSHMFAGLIVKVVLNYFLTAVPAINIIGPAIGTIVAFAIASLLNLRSIFKLVGGGLSVFRSMLKPAICAAAMGIVVHFAYPLLAGAFSGLTSNQRYLVGVPALLTVAVGVVFYGLAILATGAISRSELEMVPRIGPRLAKVLGDIGLLRR